MVTVPDHRGIKSYYEWTDRELSFWIRSPPPNNIILYILCFACSWREVLCGSQTRWEKAKKICPRAIFVSGHHEANQMSSCMTQYTGQEAVVLYCIVLNEKALPSSQLTDNYNRQIVSEHREAFNSHIFNPGAGEDQNRKRVNIGLNFRCQDYRC